MQDEDNDTTIGRGGWGLVAASGVISFVVLNVLLQYRIFPAVVFALAIALIVLLILQRLAVAVNRHDDADSARQVRRIVPASSTTEGGARVSGIEGAQASTLAAVQMRSDPAVPVPQRPVSVVTPLARVESAPLFPPQPVVAPPAPVAPPTKPVQVEVPVVEVVPEPKPKAAPKPKAEAKPKAGAKPKAEFKTKAELEALAEAKPVAAAKPVAEVKPAAEAKPKAAKPKAAAKTKAAAKPKAAKAAASGLVRLTEPRGGKADDLKLIDGVGPALEKLMNSLGFYHFDQIAAWTTADVALVDAEMKSFKGRATRDKWVVQAQILAKGGTVEDAAAAAKA